MSATWSIPQDKKLQEQCKEAAAANIDLMRQQNANKRLDFEIARLKNCGELLKSGIRFAPGTKYAKICEDVQVQGGSFTKCHFLPPLRSPLPTLRSVPLCERSTSLGLMQITSNSVELALR